MRPEQHWVFRRRVPKDHLRVHASGTVKAGDTATILHSGTLRTVFGWNPAEYVGFVPESGRLVASLKFSPQRGEYVRLWRPKVINTATSAFRAFKVEMSEDHMQKGH